MIDINNKNVAIKSKKITTMGIITKTVNKEQPIHLPLFYLSTQSLQIKLFSFLLKSIVQCFSQNYLPQGFKKQLESLHLLTA